MKKRVFLVICCLLPILGYTHPDQFVGLGDSFSDSGNTAIPPFPAPITDGNTWVVQLSERMTGGNMRPYVQGGTNFAYVGAQTMVDVPGIPSINSQVGLIPSHVDRDLVVSLQGGTNDFVSPTASANNLAQIAQNVRNKGFKTVFIANRAANAIVGISQAAVDTFNQELVRQLKARNLSVLIVDFDTARVQILATPGKFGLVPNAATTAPVVLQPTAGFFYYFDGIHLTSYAQGLLADYAHAVLSAPTQYASLSQLPLSIYREQKATIRQQMVQAQPDHEIKKIYPFIEGDYSPFLAPPQSHRFSERSAQGGTVSVGLTDRFTEGFTLGAAGSFSYNENKLRDGKNSYKADVTSESAFLFGAYKWCGRGYVDVIGNATWHQFRHLKRHFHVGPVGMTARGDTNGRQYGVEGYGSVFVYANDWVETGPLADVEYERVFVDGYREKSADFGRLQFRKQNNTAVSTGLGWETQFKNQVGTVQLVTNLSATFNRQWIKKDRNFYFREVSIPGAPFGRWPVKMPASNYVSGVFSLAAKFAQGTVLSGGYYCHLGSFHMREHFITIGLTTPLFYKPSNQVSQNKSS